MPEMVWLVDHNFIKWIFIIVAVFDWLYCLTTTLYDLYHWYALMWLVNLCIYYIWYICICTWWKNKEFFIFFLCIKLELSLGFFFSLFFTVHVNVDVKHKTQNKKEQTAFDTPVAVLTHSTRAARMSMKNVGLRFAGFDFWKWIVKGSGMPIKEKKWTNPIIFEMWS